MSESNGKDHELSGPKHSVEAKEPSCFDFLVKKGGKSDHGVVMEEPRKDNKQDLRRLHSQSSSLGDEELEGERKKNKKSLEDDDDGENGKDIQVVDIEEKKECSENIEGHLPVEQKKIEDGVSTCENTDGEHLMKNGTREKKGILEKIKEKLHKNGEREVEEHKKED